MTAKRPIKTASGVSRDQGDVSDDVVSDVIMKRSVAVATETDELGPCEPGTNVHFDGIVWQETKEGECVEFIYFIASFFDTINL